MTRRCVVLALSLSILAACSTASANPIAGCDAALGHVVGVDASINAATKGQTIDATSDFGSLVAIRDDPATDPAVRTSLATWTTAEIALETVLTAIKGNPNYTQDQQDNGLLNASNAWIAADDALTAACNWKKG